MKFNDVIVVKDFMAITEYLPSGGEPGALTDDYVNPTDKNKSGVFGGQVTALQLNVDFSAAGKMPQTSSIKFGDLKISNAGTYFDMKSVSQVLSWANQALGGGALPPGFDLATLNTFVDMLNKAFDNCVPSSWAQTGLYRP